MPRPNLGKVPVKLTVKKEILEAAREYIPNLSQFFEDKLLEVLKWVNHPLAASPTWTRRDLNPGPPPCEGGALPLSYEPFSLPLNPYGQRYKYFGQF